MLLADNKGGFAMIYVDHKITLDVHNVAAPVFVRLKKKDSARRILVYLTEKSQPYQITEDCYAVFTAKKPDGKVIFNDCTIDGNTIIYKITDQTTAAVGQFDAEIKLYGGDGKLITSPFFTIVVADTVYDEGDEIESTDEFNALAALIERVQSLETTSALVCKVALPMVALEGMTVSIPVENMSRTPKVGEAFIAMAAKRYTVFQVVAVSQNTFAATVLASVDTGGTGGSGGGIAAETDPTVPAWAKQPNKPTYTASEVGARPDTWTPTAQEVGALPNSYTPPNQTAEQVGADPKGTAAAAVSAHNTSNTAHNDIRLLIEGLTTRLNALANSTDTDLDQMAELVAYIKNNKSLIDGITTSKVSVADIVNNLTTNVANKPLSAAQGVALRALIDAITVPTKMSQLSNDKGYITDYTETDPTVPAWAKNATKPSYSKSEVGLGNVDNVKQYSASNPPPYPVTSVNGKTGTVNLDAAAVGARPSTWMPSASDVGALPASTTIPTKVSQLTNDKGYLTEHQDISGKLDASALPTAINTALAQAKASGEFDGEDGQRGTGLLSVTTAPSSYTTAVGGITPKYRMALSTIKTQAGVTEVLLGDTVRYSYYHYPIDYLDASYAYFTERVSIRGATGAAGKDYSFDPTVYRLPILYLTGDTTGMTKETEVTLSYECNDKDGTAKTGSCTMKWQGSSSLAWDKKNYTIKFDNAFEVVDGWGSQKKYCLKANWIDHSHSRNVVSAKLWGLIRKNRSNLNSKLKNLPNAGAIDGFPVIIMLNGEFHGLYSWNIPKDAWMFGMGSGTKEAIVGADNQADDTAFKAETQLDADGWELEYSSSSFTAAQVKTSMNNLINACINSWGGDLDTEVAKYLDWESAIDYYIFFVILKGYDNITKNTLLATFDGVKWYFSAYDMDSCYGLNFDGSGLSRAVSNTNFEEIAGAHRVFELIKRFKTNVLKARYKALRADALSETRICSYLENYAWDISSPLLVEEVKKWPSVRGSAVNGIDQICRWVRQRLEVCDAWIDALPAQETPVEPEKPVEMVNLVPTSTDTDGTVYNGTGYKDNARLSSSGGVSGTAQNGSVVTGFIPYTPYQTIRIKGAEWVGATAKYQGHYYLSFYNSSKALLTDAYLSSGDYDTGIHGADISAVYDSATGITTFSWLDPSKTTGITYRIKDAKYFRINAYGKGADLIVTVNQEIT
jgi:hypothetical protein